MTDQSVERPRATFGVLLAVGSLLTGLVAAFVIADMWLSPVDTKLTREGGGVELVTLVLYGVALAAFLRYVPWDLWARLFHIPVLLILFVCRELDFDKAFTEKGILQLRFYSGDTALVTKLIGGAFVLFALYVILRNLRLGAPAALRALRAQEVWPWFAVLAAVLVAFTKSIDGLARKLQGVGITISDDLAVAGLFWEEIGEAYIPICATLAIMARWKGRNT